MHITGIDTAHHQMLRKNLAEEVRYKGITDDD